MRAQENALRSADDATLADAQLAGLLAEMPLRIAYDRRVLAAIAANPQKRAGLPPVPQNAPDEALAKLIAEGEAAAEAVQAPGYEAWARIMTALAWAHYYALLWCRPEDRAMHQKWVQAIHQMFSGIQKKIDLGYVAEAVRRKRVEENSVKEENDA